MSPRRILKTRLVPGPMTEIETVDIPTFLAVGTQGHAVVVWYVAIPGAGRRTRLLTLMTGQHYPDQSVDYVGTTTVDDIVVHVFRVVE